MSKTQNKTGGSTGSGRFIIVCVNHSTWNLTKRGKVVSTHATWERADHARKLAS